MSPDAPDGLCESPIINGTPAASSRSDAAWGNLANALITECQRLAITVIDDTAATAHLRVARAIRAGTVHQPNATIALTIGATIGIVGAVLLTPRAIHGRG